MSKNRYFKRKPKFQNRKMEIDDQSLYEIPSALKKYLIFKCRVYTSAKRFSDFILTGGSNPTLYEIKQKNILSSQRLREIAIFKGF